MLSGTLRDFDYYNPDGDRNFRRVYSHNTTIPVLAICGGHQLVGLSFGAHVITLDRLEQHEQRENRPLEYQYRFVRITDPTDPIFRGINNPSSGLWQDYTKQARVLRVWQNHGLQLDRVPEGFTLLATSYLCRNQMMVKRDRRATDLHRAVSPGKVFRRLEQEPHALGTSKRIARRPHHLRKLPRPRTRSQNSAFNLISKIARRWCPNWNDLCASSVLSVSLWCPLVVFIYHRGTETTEVTQRNDLALL